MSRAKDFAKSFSIYSIGVLGTRIITFLMVPLYTYFVERPSDYGTWDICLQFCIFLLPLSTLQLREASFRFLLETDNQSTHQKIVSFIYKTLFISLLSIVLIVFTASFLTDFRYLWHTFVLLLFASIHDVVCQISRGLKRNDIYVQCNLLNAFFVGLLSVIFVAFLQLSVEGIFLANILARLMVIIFVEVRLHLLSSFFSFRIDTKEIGRQILFYSVPLIPSTMCWLITTVSDRFFIRTFVSMDMNGVYAVAIRFTMILQTLALIFYQSWQESAIQQYHSDDRDMFFSKVFKIYVFALVGMLICYSFILKLNYEWLVGANYQQSKWFIYLSGVGFLFGALSSSFFELGYQCAKDTKRLLPAVVITVLINLGLNFVLTPLWGVWGVISTSILSYLFLAIYRYYDTRRYFTLYFDKNVFFLLPVIIMGGILYSLNLGMSCDICSFIVMLIIMFSFMPKEIKEYFYKKNR